MTESQLLLLQHEFVFITAWDCIVAIYFLTILEFLNTQVLPSLTAPQSLVVTALCAVKDFHVHSTNDEFYTMLRLWPYRESIYHCPHTKQIHVVSESGDNIGLVWRKIYTSKQCQFEDVTIIHSTTASHTLGHPCLVSLLFMASLYSTLF